MCTVEALGAVCNILSLQVLMDRRLEYLDRAIIDSHPFFLFPRIRTKISSPMPVSHRHTLGKFISSCD